MFNGVVYLMVLVSVSFSHLIIYCMAMYAFLMYKWKHHFVEMKGDVGMSVHEKGGKQVNATPTHKTIYNPIPTSL